MQRQVNRTTSYDWLGLLSKLLLSLHQLYPDLDQCQWTRWFNGNTEIASKGDTELIIEIANKFGTMACSYPEDIKARVASTKEVADENGPEIYSKYNTDEGFMCLNSQQLDGLCEDYEVSLCCARKSLILKRPHLDAICLLFFV